MNLKEIALQKGMKAGGRNIQSLMQVRKTCILFGGNSSRCFATDRDTTNQLRAKRVREHVKDLSNKHKAKKQARALEKDFFLSVLHSSATKREAKSYLQRFTPPKGSIEDQTSSTSADHKQDSFRGNGVNLGSFYGSAAVQRSPKFVQHPHRPPRNSSGSHLHVALVKLRAPQSIGDDTLDGIGRTLSQLARMGLLSVVVVDCNDTSAPITENDTTHWRKLGAQQADRIISAIEKHDTQARFVDSSIGISIDTSNPASDAASKKSTTRVNFRDMLLKPLKKGIIPVVPSLAYVEEFHTLKSIPASEVVLALTNEFAGLGTEALPDEAPDAVRERLNGLQEEVSLDRLIILDPLGGIPCSQRENGYHVFLNMEQEFVDAKRDLLGVSPSANDALEAQPSKPVVSPLGSSNPTSKFAEVEFGSISKLSDASQRGNAKQRIQGNWHQLDNLELARSVLALLPPSSSALLTSPEEAANSGKDMPFQATGVGTRRQKNPLIHNLLTDRPVFSSSLPVGRLGGSTLPKKPVPSTGIVSPTTFAKHGMSVSIYPDARYTPWQPPIPGQPQLNLTDPQLDLPRLVHLIEDSFGRKLDVQDYLKRVSGRLAGIIIAGEYEGGALLTWELPPGVVDDGSLESRSRMVPYLDKFAVLKKRQGSATADLVFKAMVRECFPNGVCWRSRKTNVVNKWYFERSRGTWKLPDTGWTMFWTTPDLSMDKQTFLDYESVCKSIQPSWADNKAILD